MRIASWNLNVRRDSAAQVQALRMLSPDVFVMQEVTVSTWARLAPLLAAAGLPHQVCGPDLLPPGRAQLLSRFVAVASAWPLRPATPAEVPAPEVIVCVEVEAPQGPLELIGVHVPTIAKGWLLKVETEEGLGRKLDLDPGRPRIVCGDFNAPRGESHDGVVTPFARPRDARGRAAELAVCGDPGRFGLVDVFRAVNGYEAADRSWWWKNRGKTGGYRLDHIFASKELPLLDCRYRHDLREAGLSDHSPIYATFAS